MIQLTSTHAVSWPTPPSAAVAPVAPVPVVQALPGGGQGTQTGLGSGREHHRGFAVAQPRGDSPGAGQGAAGSPREAAVAQDAATTQATAQAQASQRQAEQAAQHAERERDRQAMEHLRSVLANVWQASASVVDRALGREDTSSTPGAQSDTAPDLSQVAASLVSRRTLFHPGARSAANPALASPSQGWTQSAEPSDESSAALDRRALGDVQAYDERGNSSLAPLEAGRLVSNRV